MSGWLTPFRATLLATLALATAPAAASPSAYLTAPDDPRAVTVAGARDGREDDTQALQSAIDAAADKGGGGIVFVPSGHYRISRTLYIWPGVRVFGVGKTRPVIVLGDATPGFQQGVANMVIFAGARPGEAGIRGGERLKPARVPFPPPGSVPFNPDIADANPGTFYPALSNVDFRIGAGNPAATAIRFHAAQHAYLAHIDFELGSGLAGLYQVANQAEDLHFHGGRYGILTEKPSPAWQFTLLDSSFDGQREAAIREHEASLTLVNVAFRDVPTAIDIDRGYGDWLWGKDVRFENVSNAAVVISNETNVYTQIGFDNALASATPIFARFRDSGKTVAGAGGSYRVSRFGYGLMLPGLGTTGQYETVMQAAPIARLPAPPPPAIRALPATTGWANVRALGAKGDDRTDDTAAIQRAIDTHRTVYFPAGRYVVTDTLRLRPDSVLVALHPSLTQIILPDRTPAFQGVGNAKPLIESARGGDAIVSGLGLFTGGIKPRATALLWQAGARSLVEDVKFQGGHGTDLADGSRFDPYNANHTGDPDPAKRWDAQYPSLWVRGGGGTFANLWSPNTYAQAGMLVSDTDVPGHVYQMSIEHHARAEFVLDHVANWEFLAPQTEEEAGESQDAVSFDIRHSRDLLIANLHAYRVTRSLKPAPTAVRLTDSAGIRFRNMHVNAESGLGTCDENGCATYLRASKFPYDTALQDVTHGLEVREREFAALDVPADPVAPAPSGAFANGKVERLADGFFSAAGGAVDAQGKLYFVDHWKQRIYAWSRADGLAVVRDTPLDPVNLAVDRSDKLLVLSSDGRNGTVYSLDPADRDGTITVIPPTPAANHPGAVTALPVNYWVNGEFKDQLDTKTFTYPTLADMFARDIGTAKPREYVSPDGSLVLPAYRTFQQGPSNFLGWRFSDALDSYGFTTARAGADVFVTNGSENKTYRGRLAPGGALRDLTAFADRGGESVTTDAQGRVYVANGQVFVYDRAGTEIGRIDIPERPLQLLVGGAQGKTLFVLTHHALYGVALE
ncbi:glycosyl hydrolase family 28-related protein [Sphingomonas sp. H39-1-10]|uniref:glycosyl hydrolase family 28-related protein n=1 Tax=Sphingomonas pollutisoli TaxID=3030829 RepID=UPI0023B89AFD|nr:glycosyl hydrolase family 28-related protein [Sphingomonas pollutisoli]MDF0489633.1 glycosyl hydrolase family 28-related protein [Sphingomonas pollutisoli]